MFTRYFINLLIVAILSIFFHPIVSKAQADPCEAFAKYGLYDSFSTASDVDKSSSFRSWFCQRNFSSSDEANRVGISLGYEELTLGYNADNQSWETFSTEYCSDEKFEDHYKQHTLTKIQKINPIASNNMLACFNRSGIHARIIPGANPKKFKIELDYRADQDTDIKIRSISISNATCETNNLKNNTVIKPGQIGDLCTRNNDEAVEVALYTSRKPIWDSPTSIPAIPKKQVNPLIKVQCPRGTRIFENFTKRDANHVGTAKSKVIQFNVNAVTIDDSVNNIGINRDVNCSISIEPTPDFKILNAVAEVDYTRINTSGGNNNAAVGTIIRTIPSLSDDGRSSNIKVKTIDDPTRGTVNLNFNVNYIKLKN